MTQHYPATVGTGHECQRTVPAYWFDPAGYGLVELPVARWQGCLLVNSASGAPPFAGYGYGRRGPRECSTRSMRRIRTCLADSR